jgi:hypothetical protein
MNRRAGGFAEGGHPVLRGFFGRGKPLKLMLARWPCR